MAQQARRGQEIRSLLFATPVEDRHIEQVRAAVPDLDVRRSDWPPPADVLADVDGAVLWSVRPEWLDAAPRLRWIHSGGAGVEDLPLAEIARHGIVLTNNSGVHVPQMPEHLLALMLCFARGLPRLFRAQQERRWRDTETHAEVFDLAGQTVLLVGMGEIGLGLGERAAALGMRVGGVRRRVEQPSPPFVERVWPVADRREALAWADHVAISLPLTPATRGLVGAAELAAMRPGTYLYNVGRGPVVDHAALQEALRRGHLGGAGLDVTDPEPLPPASPLWEMDNVVITAHTAGASPKYWDRAVDLIAENARRLRAGEPPLNLVDLEAGY